MYPPAKSQGRAILSLVMSLRGFSRRSGVARGEYDGLDTQAKIRSGNRVAPLLPTNRRNEFPSPLLLLNTLPVWGPVPFCSSSDQLHQIAIHMELARRVHINDRDTKTLAVPAPPVQYQMSFFPCVTRQVPLAAKAPSFGRAGGRFFPESRFQFVPPSSVTISRNCRLPDR